MSSELRVGLLYTAGDLAQSIREQCLGAELAAGYTCERSSETGEVVPVLVRRAVRTGDDVRAAAAALVQDEGCQALLGALSVPHSIRAAEWAEEHEVLYATANNDPRVGGGRRHVFHIGVPSEVTGAAVTRFLVEERGAKRVGLLHATGEFQVHAANCTATPLRARGADVLQVGVDELQDVDEHVLDQLREWRPDAIMIYDSDTERQIRLARQAHALGGFPPFGHARGILCREYRDAAGRESAGHFFVDMYLRSPAAPSEEQVLHRFLRAQDSQSVATASHGFGWDELRLLVAAYQNAGSDPTAQIAFLESRGPALGAGGPLTFTPADHNGRWAQDPTTIAELVNGEFAVVSTLGR